MDNNQILARIADKLNKIHDDVDKQGNRLTAIESDLKFHIQRSERLEQIVAQHEKYFWFAMGSIALAGPIATEVLKLVFKQ